VLLLFRRRLRLGWYFHCHWLRLVVLLPSVIEAWLALPLSLGSQSLGLSSLSSLFTQYDTGRAGVGGVYTVMGCYYQVLHMWKVLGTHAFVAWRELGGYHEGLTTEHHHLSYQGAVVVVLLDDIKAVFCSV
jgi:hypothetical protein